ncbi:MAG: hypothetical protein R6V85_00685 [Polyangia bacterium]
MVQVTQVEKQQCSTGLEQPVAVMLAYMFGWISGLIFFLVEKQNRFVRFSAMQSILINGVLLAVVIVLSILSMIPFLGMLFGLINLLLIAGAITGIVFLIVFAWQDKKVSLPVLGEMAEKWSAGPPAA